MFILFIVGEVSITSGLIKNAKKFGFAICMMNSSFKLYEVIGTRMEGNTILRKYQYGYDENYIGTQIVINKIHNQRVALNSIRNKSPKLKSNIKSLDEHILKLQCEDLDYYQVIGIEGLCARLYFSNIFNNTKWNGRKPRIKNDFVNASLDIGYNLLFNFIDSILQVFGFDTYYGVLHRAFYMRKSLVCDIIEPFRPIIDLKLRKAINLGQCKEEDFKVFNKRYVLEYKNSSKYVAFYMETILEYKDEIFLYIQTYYRFFMKGKNTKEFPVFELE